MANKILKLATLVNKNRSQIEESLECLFSNYEKVIKLTIYSGKTIDEIIDCFKKGYLLTKEQ